MRNGLVVAHAAVLRRADEAAVGTRAHSDMSLGWMSQGGRELGGAKSRGHETHHSAQHSFRDACSLTFASSGVRAPSRRASPRAPQGSLVLALSRSEAGRHVRERAMRARHHRAGLTSQSKLCSVLDDGRRSVRRCFTDRPADRLVGEEQGRQGQVGGAHTWRRICVRMVHGDAENVLCGNRITCCHCSRYFILQPSTGGMSCRPTLGTEIAARGLRPGGRSRQRGARQARLREHRRFWGYQSKTWLAAVRWVARGSPAHPRHQIRAPH
jgi:hypothetical protein